MSNDYVTLGVNTGGTPVKTAQLGIGTRGVPTQAGWVGQVLIDGEIVVESLPLETWEQAVHAADAIVTSRLRALFVVPIFTDGVQATEPEPEPEPEPDPKTDFVETIVQAAHRYYFGDE